MSKKIYANKSESAASVISKVLNASDNDIVLYIPRGALFAGSRNNFLLLKREARVANKTVSVESVDDDILELAVTAGLKAANPFLGKKQKSVSDIVSIRESEEEEAKTLEEESKGPLEEYEEVQIKKKRFKFRRKRGRKKLTEKPSVIAEEPQSVDVFDETEAEEPAIDLGGAEEEISTHVSQGEKVRKLRVGGRKPKKARAAQPPRSKLWWVVGGVVLVTGSLVALFVLPRVTIKLGLEKTDWNFVGSLNVGTSIKENSFDGDTISLRGISFSEKKNISKTYPATGSDNVERKATGIITVYNDYSEESQELVEHTRFWTPDGKEYKTDNDIVIPGASMVDGELVPSSIDVPVTASEAGEEYNIGPVPKFRIPGFQGSPKYDGFYGESKAPMTGGFVGERKVPTDEDIDAARKDILGSLEDSAKSQLFLNLPPGTKVLDGTYRFEVTDENVDEGASDSSNFSITEFGEASVMVFREDELVQMFEDRVEKDNGVNLQVDDYTVDYGEPRDVDGVYSSAISVTSTWIRPFDPEIFKTQIVGKNETELKQAIFSIPGVQSGEVKFWPFWVNKVPKKASRIIVDVN